MERDLLRLRSGRRDIRRCSRGGSCGGGGRGRGRVRRQELGLWRTICRNRQIEISAIRRAEKLLVHIAFLKNLAQGLVIVFAVSFCGGEAQSFRFSRTATSLPSVGSHSPNGGIF